MCVVIVVCDDGIVFCFCFCFCVCGSLCVCGDGFG